MESRRSSSVSSYARSYNDQVFAAFKASVEEELDLWTGMIPPENDSSFQSLIQRHTETVGAQHDAARLFQPIEQHCGLWKDAPNKECHTSFGDKGTTASVSSYGHLMQMSQFLGAGHSGIFSIDHSSTSEPYYVVSRAEDLSGLGSGVNALSFGLCLPDKYLPNHAPDVKWVNWRWPRYEWRRADEDMSVRISTQWVIKHNTVFQQTIVTNTGSSPIEDFSVREIRNMLIRDLDYLQFHANGELDSSTYKRGRGPNGFGWITANFLGNEKSLTIRENDTGVSHASHTADHERDRPQSRGQRERTSENEQMMPSSSLSRGESRPRSKSGQTNLEPHLPSPDDQIAGLKDVSVNQQETEVEQHKVAEQQQARPLNGTKLSPSDDELWKKRRITDTWSAKDAHAVVSIMSLFVNGTAQQTDMDGDPLQKTIGVAGSCSDVLEITVAYKMIAIPKYKVHWKNFLIPAATADVSTMLAAETEDIWAHAITDDCKCAQSLCETGISMIGLEQDVKQDVSGQGRAAQDSGTANHGAQKGRATHDNPTNIAKSTMDVSTDQAFTAAEPNNEQNVAQGTSARPITGATGGTPQKLSPITSAIEYLTWRHTEHILSVCTIPLSAPTLAFEEDMSEQNIPVDQAAADTFGTSRDEAFEPEVPLALTCGDMSGHRICTSASFFAFDFLIGVLRRLRRLPSVKQTQYLMSLRRRINAVFLGHIRWLEWIRKPWIALDCTDSLLASGCFAANYWVNGQIMPSGSESWQPDDAVTDTPFQVLKVTAYIKWVQTVQNIQSLDDQKLRHHMALLRDIWVCLIRELDIQDKREACAWRHTIKDGLSTYRLDDHVWLWDSLSELHNLDLWSLTDTGRGTSRDSPDRWFSIIHSLSPAEKIDEDGWLIVPNEARDRKELTEFSSKAGRLAPQEVQKKVLQRFTVENDVSQERMLAVTRSARDTRFFFHTRDTVLLYARGRKFFRPDTSFSELWERTIRCQCHHEEALEEERHNPLQLALKAVAGLNGFSIDKRRPRDLAKQSVQALIQASAHSAFIPGEIDVVNREPSIFSEERDRDYYYHVGFEVCHFLLEHARGIDEVFRSEQTRSKSSTAPTKQVEHDRHQALRELNHSILNEILTELKKQKMANHPYRNEHRAFRELSGAEGRLDRKRTHMAMKRSMPFNTMIDASSITALDEEWLYNYPDFLLTQSFDLYDQLEALYDRFTEKYKPVNGSLNSIVDKALRSLERPPPREFPFSTVKFLCDGLVASLPKQKNRRKKRGTRDIGASLTQLSHPQPNNDLWDSIRGARSAINAKKRFLWLPQCSDPQTALLCWLSSPESEKNAISLFFDRHAAYENRMWDDTTMVLNSWQTELHISFWLIYDKDQPLHEGLPDPVKAEWPRGSRKELRRACAGFRFNGDFFDRYWTCHFIQYVPGSAMSRVSSDLPKEWQKSFKTEKYPWQRKVLELQLLQYMLNLILTSSNNILEDIEAELGLKKGTLTYSVLTTEAYSSSADHWQIYEAFLEKAEEDITSSLNTLSKWATRDEDRGQERPRWTRNDERKYRGNINKLRSHTERQRWDLESCRAKMCKLRESLTSRQAKIRSDLETKREQNIQYFTYVTVIFLPLGFASSFYSMNGTPSNDLIVSLAKFAAAAFAVTVMLLFSVSLVITSSAKRLPRAKLVVSQRLQKCLVNTRRQSLLVKRAPDDDEIHTTKWRHQPHSKKFWMASPWFWPAYVFLELPTRTISSARTALVTGTLSANTVWMVVLSIAILPFYASTRVVLILWGNMASLFRISRHLYRIYIKPLSREDRAFWEQVVENRKSDEQAHRRRPSQKEALQETGDPETLTFGGGPFPDHFKDLMPTIEPLPSLHSLERELLERAFKSKFREARKIQDKAEQARGSRID